MTENFLALCARRLSGEATPEECRQLAAFLRDPDHRPYFEELEQKWDTLAETDAPPIDLKGAHDRYHRKILAEAASASSVLFRFPRQAIRWLSVAAAASLLLGVWLWHTGGETSKAPEIPWVTRTATSGERVELRLADGTLITLDAGSRLTYPEFFDKAHRTVRLEGEAFFVVTRDVHRPFIVEAGALRTTVLGTKFNVRAFAGEGKSTVALVEGKVTVESPEAKGQDTQVLDPGQLFSWNHGTGQGNVTRFDAVAVLGWMTGRLVFRDERLEDIADQLGRRFGVSIELTHPALADKRMSLSFEKEGLPEIMDVLSFAGGLHCELIRTHGTVTGARILPAR